MPLRHASLLLLLSLPRLCLSLAPRPLRPLLLSLALSSPLLPPPALADVPTQLWRSSSADGLTVAFPQGWYISDRLGADAFGNRLLVSALDLKSGFVASVSLTDVRAIFQEFYGMDTTLGRRVEKLADLGGEERLAQLLQRQRDGSLKQAPLTSEVRLGESGRADTLAFSSRTVFKPQERVAAGPKTPFGGPAPPSKSSEDVAKMAATTIVRRSESRAFLTGSQDQPRLVTLWVSALEEQWENGAEVEKAQAILQSFAPKSE